MARRASTAALIVALSLPLGAQSPPGPAGPAAAGTVRKALETGAISRVLGRRWFEDETGGIVRFTGEKLEGGALRFSLEFLPVAAMREERTVLACELDAQGAVRSVSSELVRGKERISTRGEVADGKLRLTAEPGGEKHEAEWSAEVVPLPLLVFVLPALCDQGLPERLAVRVFHGFDRAPARTTGALAWALRDGRWEVAMKDLAPGQPDSRVAADPATGALREVTVSGMRMTPITIEEGEQRLAPPK